MNHPESPFLQEILADEHAAEFRAGSIEKMLLVARERRHRRNATRIAAWTSLPVLILLGLTIWLLTPPAAPTMRVQPNPPPKSSSPPSALVRAETSHIHYLSDEDLLTLFPGRQVALIGHAGAQKLVFLDGKGQP